MKLFIDEITGEEYAIIEHADGSFTSMTKAEYDRRQAEQSTPSVMENLTEDQ